MSLNVYLWIHYQWEIPQVGLLNMHSASGIPVPVIINYSGPKGQLQKYTTRMQILISWSQTYPTFSYSWSFKYLLKLTQDLKSEERGRNRGRERVTEKDKHHICSLYLDFRLPPPHWLASVFNAFEAVSNSCHSKVKLFNFSSICFVCPEQVCPLKRPRMTAGDSAFPILTSFMLLSHIACLVSSTSLREAVYSPHLPAGDSLSMALF